MRLSFMRLSLAIALLCLAARAADGTDTTQRRSFWSRITSPVAGLYRRGRKAVVRASKALLPWRKRSTIEVAQDEVPDEALPTEKQNELAAELDTESESADVVTAKDPADETAVLVETEGSHPKGINVAKEMAAPVEMEGSHPKEVDAVEMTEETAEETAAPLETEESDLKEIAEAIAVTSPSKPEEQMISETAAEVVEKPGVLTEAKERAPGVAEAPVLAEVEEAVVENGVNEAVVQGGKSEAVVNEKVHGAAAEL